MKGLIIVVPVLTVVLILEIPVIRRATYSKLLKEKPTLHEIIQENAPDIAKMIKQVKGDTVYLKNGAILIFGMGRFAEKARTADQLLKSGESAKIIDLSVPGYALIKNGGKK